MWGRRGSRLVRLEPSEQALAIVKPKKRKSAGEPSAKRRRVEKAPTEEKKVPPEERALGKWLVPEALTLDRTQKPFRTVYVESAASRLCLEKAQRPLFDRRRWVLGDSKLSFKGPKGEPREMRVGLPCLDLLPARNVIQYLQVKDMARFTLTSRLWHRLCDDEIKVQPPGSF